MPRQSMVNSAVKSSRPTGSVLELTERVSCEASANSFQRGQEGEDRGRGDARTGERKLDLPERLPARAAVDLRRLREVARHLAEEAVDQPDRERHVEGDIGQDQPEMRVDDADARKMMNSGSDSAMPGTVRVSISPRNSADLP